MPAVVFASGILQCILEDAAQCLLERNTVHIEDNVVGTIGFFGWTKKWIGIGVDKIVAAGGVDPDIDAGVVGHFEYVETLFDIPL